MERPTVVLPSPDRPELIELKKQIHEDNLAHQAQCVAENPGIDVFDDAGEDD